MFVYHVCKISQHFLRARKYEQIITNKKMINRDMIVQTAFASFGNQWRIFKKTWEKSATHFLCRNNHFLDIMRNREELSAPNELSTYDNSISTAHIFVLCQASRKNFSWGPLPSQVFGKILWTYSLGEKKICEVAWNSFYGYFFCSTPENPLKSCFHNFTV